MDTDLALRSDTAGFDIVEAFILQNGLDERAAGALRSLRPEVLQAVLDRGSLQETNNPSSAVLGRIRTAQTAQTPVHTQIMQFPGAGTKRSPEFPAAGHEKRFRAASPEELEAFIVEGGLDQRAADAVRASDPVVQAIVIERGSLRGAANPSAALIGRLRDAVKMSGAPANVTSGRTPLWGSGGASGGACGASGGPFGGMQAVVDIANIAEHVELFIASCNLDERAANALRTSPPAVQQAVISRGSVEDARNPSSALLGRLKDAQAAAKGDGAYGGSGGALGGCFGVGAGAEPLMDLGVRLQLFIQENALDDMATQALLNAGQDVQQAVLERGSLRSTSNPSSAVIGRLRDAVKGAGKGIGSIGSNGPSGGDGVAAARGDTGLAALAAHANLAGGPAEATLKFVVMSFIEENGLDERAQEALLKAEPAVQLIALAKGSLKETRNPSSALCGRLKDAVAEVKEQRNPSSAVLGRDAVAEVKETRSSALLDRLRDALAEVQGNGGLAPGAFASAGNSMNQKWGSVPAAAPSRAPLSQEERDQKIIELVTEIPLESQAVEALMYADPAVQDFVISRGSLAHCRDASSVLMSRLNEATQALNDPRRKVTVDFALTKLEEIAARKGVLRR